MLVVTPKPGTSIAEVQTRLMAEYGTPESDFPLRHSLERLQSAFGTLAAVNGKTILDLGCGAVRGTGEVDANPGTWGPWLPRAVVELGGKAVALDIGFVPASEKFTFHRVDLRKPDCLSFLESNSFDAINCSNLFSSPHLIFRLGEHHQARREGFRSSLLAQTERLLRPNGIIIHFDSDFNNW